MASTSTFLLPIAQITPSNVSIPLLIAWIIFNLICLSIFFWINKSKKTPPFDSLVQRGDEEPSPPPQPAPPPPTPPPQSSQPPQPQPSAPLPQSPPSPPSQPIPALPQTPEKPSLLQTEEGAALLEEIKNLKSLIADLNASAARKRQPTTTITADEEIEEISISASEILQALTEAVFAVDRSGTVLHMNRAASKLFGYQPEEILGDTLDPLIWVDVNPTAIRRPVLAEDPAFGLEQDGFGIRKDGSRFPAVVTVSVVRVEPMILAVSVRDTSPRPSIPSQIQPQTAPEKTTPTSSSSYVPPVPLAQTPQKRPARRIRKKIIHPN